MNAYNLPHRECREDERWIGNVYANTDMSYLPYPAGEWRQGEAAYGYDGDHRPDMRPVFVKVATLDRCGHDVDAMLDSRIRRGGMIVDRIRREGKSKKAMAMEARNARLKEAKAREDKIRATGRR